MSLDSFSIYAPTSYYYLVTNGTIIKVNLYSLENAKKVSCRNVKKSFRSFYRSLSFLFDFVFPIL